MTELTLASFTQQLSDAGVQYRTDRISSSIIGSMGAGGLGYDRVTVPSANRVFYFDLRDHTLYKTRPIK